MEALRKAEEAKRKDSEESGIDPSSGQSVDALPVDLGEKFDLAPGQSAASITAPESGDLQSDFDIAVSQHSAVENSGLIGAEKTSQSTASQDLDLHPMAEPPVEQISLQERESIDGIALQADLAISPLDAEGESSDPGRLILEGSQELEPELIREVSAGAAQPQDLENASNSIESDAWRSRARKLSNPRKYRKYALVIILFLFVIGGAFVWFLGFETTPQTQVAAASPDRGFLGGPDPIETAELEELEAVAVSAAASSESTALNVAIDRQSAGSSENFVIDGNQNLPLEPENSDSQDGRAISRSVQNDVFRVSPSLQSLQLDDLQNQAASAEQAGYSNHAREQYEWLLTAQPNNSEALMGLARLDLKDGNFEAVRASYIRLLELDPSDPLAQAGLLGLDQSGDTLAYESQLKALSIQHPEVAPLSFALGNLFASQRRWNEAEGAYARALASARNFDESLVSPDYAFNLAVALERLSKPREAYLNYLAALEFSEQIAPSFERDLLVSRIEYLGAELQ